MLVVAQAMQAHDSYHHGVSSVEMPPAVCRTYLSPSMTVCRLITDSSNHAE